MFTLNLNRPNALFLLTFLAAAFIVNALPAPLPIPVAAPSSVGVAVEERAVVLGTDICSELNVGLDGVLTSLAKAAKSGEDPTLLFTQLVTSLGVCAKAIVAVNPSKFDKGHFTTLVVNLFINLQSVLILFVNLGSLRIKSLLALILSIKLDTTLVALLSSCNKVYANVVVEVGLQLGLKGVLAFVELGLVATLHVLGLGLLGL
ncbi:hypothetical protein SISNIDRAFT_491004 [Sistotremastrum niveocremeum HHB9708]|uniref:Transmembrane protein n=1 Tax=Sistotremastrum niveocremeum HHB9708 TaxID=1314777 RepID=A0A164NBE1_9AGAM|nr:hypothetical protein SISNIDRAFT_491004 [Sistotremastrum niveocremeum HHB9708]